MGRPFSDQEATDFQQMIGWYNYQILTLREWCGLCGAAERLIGKTYLCHYNIIILSHRSF